jgi:Tfp pilus assembly protein PilN
VILRTNLATRPFYNTRVVRAIVALLAVIVIAITLFDVIQDVRLSAQEGTLGGRADQAEREAQRLRGQAAQIRAQIDPRDLASVSAEAREANAIIDRRAFSWTELLAQFEKTLPPDVRITAVQPRIEQNGDFVVSMIVQARRIEDLDAFMDALEKRSSFHDVRQKEEQTNNEGLIEAVVDATYVPLQGQTAPATARGGAR